jgi:pimeloyl-ACP methyl ester carboxylesterase
MTQFTHDTAPTRYAEAGGTRFAYRRFGSPGRPPLVFFQHFMGNLDDHDPAVSDAFASDREVILFNNPGVASSSGIVPDTIEAMAGGAITFIDALGLTTIDVVGHSMDRAASLLPGLLAATRTGLSPAGDDELTNTKEHHGITSRCHLLPYWAHVMAHYL